MRTERLLRRPGVVVVLSLVVLFSISCSGSSSSPSSSSAPTTFLSLVSSPGDQIGNGFTQRVDLSDAIFSARSYLSGSTQNVDIEVTPKDGTRAWWWTLFLSPPPGQPLRVGTYDGVKRWPAAGTQAGMDFFGTGRGCSFLSGRFVIDDLALGASDGFYTNIDRLHMTFEQRCDSATASLVGEISILANPWR